MSSFLQKCPQCSAMIAKGHPCPECHWSEQSEPAPATAAAGGGGGGEAVALSVDAIHEYSQREKTHIRNYAIFMVLMLGTGLIGLLTAYMWFRFLYLGDIGALLRVGLLTLITGGLGVLLKFSKKLCPIDLNCPSCGVQLDQVGLNGNHCPGCSAQLK